MKKIIAITLTLVMIFALSTTAFAALGDGNGNVDSKADYRLKVFADPIVEGAKTINVGFGIVDTSGGDIVLEGCSTGKIQIACSFPKSVIGFVENAPVNKLTTANPMDEDANYALYEDGLAYFAYGVNVPEGTNITLTPETIICTLTLKLSDNITEGTYNFLFDDFSRAGSVIDGWKADEFTHYSNLFPNQPDEFDGFKVIKSTPAKTAVLTFEGVEGTKTVDENGKLVGDVPTLADKTEATFDGWAVKGTTDKVDFTTATFTEDTTFEAIWKTRTFTVKFVTNGAKETVADQTVEYGKTVTDPGPLTKDGYTFDGWDKDIATAITENTTFTAKWTKNHVAAECGTELSEVKPYADGFYYEGRYYFIANDDVVTKYGVSIKGATSTKDFVGNKKVEGSAKVLYRIALINDSEDALNVIVATPFINK